MENFLADLSRAQARQGHEVFVLAHHHLPFRRSQTELLHGVRLWRVPVLGEFLYVPLAPTLPLALKQAVSSFKPDILHLHLPNPAAFLALFLARNRPLVIHWHADVVASRFDRRLALAYHFYRPFEQALLRRARLIIATSPPYLETSRALAPHRDKTRVVPLGLDPERLHQPDPQERERLVQKTRPFVLSVGRLTYYKGFPYLLEAVALLPEARLWLVGRGKLEKFLRQKIKELKIENRVRLLSGLKDRELHVLLSACRVFCLPSIERTEAFGLVLLEALAFGRPLVTTAVEGSGMSWVNRHGETGLVVPPEDPKALAGALEKILQDPDLFDRLAEGAKRRFSEEFHIDRVATRLNTLYEEIYA